MSKFREVLNELKEECRKHDSCADCKYFNQNQGESNCIMYPPYEDVDDKIKFLEGKHEV